MISLDRDLKGLTDALKLKKEKNKDSVKLVKVVDLDTALVVKEKFDEISIVGHGRYYDQETHQPLPINARKIADKPLEEVAGSLVELAERVKVRVVKFYTCESACYSDGVRRSSSLDKKEDTSDFTHEDCNRIDQRLASKGISLSEDSQCSTTQYFAYRFLSQIGEKDGRHITVQGLNGVGCISDVSEGKPCPPTVVFDQKYLKEYEEAEKAYKDLDQTNKGKSPKQKQANINEAHAKMKAFEEKYVEGYPAPHKLKLHVHYWPD